MIDALLRTALPGSAVVLAWLAADALLEKRLPALWHYRVLKLALFLFLVRCGLWRPWRQSWRQDRLPPFPQPCRSWLRSLSSR